MDNHSACTSIQTNVTLLPLALALTLCAAVNSACSGAPNSSRAEAQDYWKASALAEDDLRGVNEPFVQYAKHLIVQTAQSCNRVFPITAQTPETAVLDREQPNWRATDETLFNIPLPSLKSFQEETDRKLRRQPEALNCRWHEREQARTEAYLKGLRLARSVAQARENAPANPPVFSSTIRPSGLTDQQAYCLSGTFNLNGDAAVAGVHIFYREDRAAPEPQIMSAHPFLSELPQRVLTPRDLTNAGCTAELRTEAMSLAAYSPEEP